MAFIEDNPQLLIIIDASALLSAHKLFMSQWQEMLNGWMVLSVRVGSESKCIDKVDELGDFETFLPMYKRWVKVAKHNKKKVGSNRTLSLLPLYPGYVFIKPRSDIFQSKGLFGIQEVFSIVKLGDRISFASESSIKLIRDGVDSGEYDDLAKDPPQIKLTDALGKVAAVMSGPLQGYKGKVVARCGDEMQIEIGKRTKVWAKSGLLELAA